MHLAHAERDMDERISIAAPRLDQQHARPAILRQPVGEHTAGGTGTDDDVVVTPARHATAPTPRKMTRLIPRGAAKSSPRMAADGTTPAGRRRPDAGDGASG